jgi:hypothetical protein
MSVTSCLSHGCHCLPPSICRSLHASLMAGTACLPPYVGHFMPLSWLSLPASLHKWVFMPLSWLSMPASLQYVGHFMPPSWLSLPASLQYVGLHTSLMAVNACLLPVCRSSCLPHGYSCLHPSSMSVTLCHPHGCHCLPPSRMSVFNHDYLMAVTTCLPLVYRAFMPSSWLSLPASLQYVVQFKPSSWVSLPASF